MHTFHWLKYLSRKVSVPDERKEGRIILLHLSFLPIQTDSRAQSDVIHSGMLGVGRCERSHV